MNRPAITDTAGIADATRRNGSVDYYFDDIPGDFIAWRRRIRQAATKAGRRVSVHRIGPLVLIYDPDHLPTVAQKAPAVRAVTAKILGDEPDVVYDEELHRRHRARMRIVRDDEP